MKTSVKLFSDATYLCVLSSLLLVEKSFDIFIGYYLILAQSNKLC